jgi:hypothetical protein
VVVIPLERAGSRIGNDGESETTTVGETVRVDWETGFAVDWISLLSGSAYGETVSRCLLPSRGWDRWPDEVVLRSESGSSLGSGPVDGMIAAVTGSEC